MDIATYKQLREQRLGKEIPYRGYCLRCRKAAVTCYCDSIKPFDSQPQFVILMHPHEAKRSIATGRMTHLCLRNSSLFVGLDFTDHAPLNAMLTDPKNFPVLLFPDREAHNISSMTQEARAQFSPPGRHLVVVVLDGTWDQARSLKYQSANLQKLPRICFTPPRQSEFKIRKQPAAHCYSTIESVHELIRLLGNDSENNSAGLLDAFAAMVTQQIDYAEAHQAIHGVRATRGVRRRGSAGFQSADLI